MTTTDLLRRLQAGDASAAPALVRACLPAVRSLALAGTLDPARAGEVARRALERILARVHEARDASRLLAIVEEVTREEVRGALKGSGGRKAHLLGLPASAAEKAKGPVLSLPAVLGAEPPEKASWMLLEAASFLPPRSQALFLLRYLEGLSYGEIADLTGTTTREVGTGLAAARRLYEREFGNYLRKLGAP